MEQRKEIWFTFNYIANFIRMPALAIEDENRLRNAVRWLQALAQAYADNPAIDCVLYYLLNRLEGRFGNLSAQKYPAHCQ